MTKPHATCAALMDNDVRCEKTKQCMRAVNWPDNPHASFNLCCLLEGAPSSTSSPPCPSWHLRPSGNFNWTSSHERAALNKLLPSNKRG